MSQVLFALYSATLLTIYRNISKNASDLAPQGLLEGNGYIFSGGNYTVCQNCFDSLLKRDLL